MSLKLRHILFFITSISTVGCGSGFMAAKNSGAIDVSSICNASNVSQKTYSVRPRFFTDGPIVLDEWSQASVSFANLNIASKTSSHWLIPRGKFLNILMSNECVESLPTLFQMRSNLLKGKTSTENSYSVELTQDIAFDELQKIVNETPCIKGLSPAIKIKKSALPNDPFIIQQNHLTTIGLTDVYDFYFAPATGIKNDILIAVIDDGLDLNHIEFRDRLWINVAEQNGLTGVDDDNNGYLDDIHGYDFQSNSGNPEHKNDSYHGTHVTGLIAAASNNSIGVTGVMGQKTKIMVLNIFGDNAELETTTNIDRAIRYAADNGAKVINMSLGGAGRSSTTAEALNYAVQKGATILVAAGNDGAQLTNNNFFTPASYAPQIKGVISVAATDVRNPAQLCEFSNYSATVVEFAAPGCDTNRRDLGLFSTLPNDSGGYLAGTSMATPVASGAAALMIAMIRDQANKILTPSEAETLLISSSPMQAALTTSVASGRRLALKSTADAVAQNYLQAAPTSPTDSDNNNMCETANNVK